jgi:hypothetical protein
MQTLATFDQIFPVRWRVGAGAVRGATSVAIEEITVRGATMAGAKSTARLAERIL